MANSERVALCVAHSVVGMQVWSNRLCATMPDEHYEATVEAGFALLAVVAQAIDFPRLLMEAEMRHATVHDGRSAGDGLAPLMAVALRSTTVCGECLYHALIANGPTPFFPDWHAEPEATPRAAGLDWAEVFAAAITHRRERKNPANTPGT